MEFGPFKVFYVPEDHRLMKLADTLSRMPLGTNYPEESKHPSPLTDQYFTSMVPEFRRTPPWVEPIEMTELEYKM